MRRYPLIGVALAGLLTVTVTVAVTAAPRGEGEGYVRKIETAAALERFSKPSALPIVERQTKFIVPVRDGDETLLPTLFQNVNHYPLHIEFFKGEFPDRFAGLSLQEYAAMVELRATRQYYAGILYVFGGETPSYGFEIFTRADEAPTIEETRWVYDHVGTAFTLGPVAYAPKERNALR